MKQMREAVWSMNRDLPLARVRTMEEVYRASMARSPFTLVMLAIAGGMVLLLGIVGIYGVISYSVSQRTRELGIRIAMGAPHGALKSMVVRQGVLLAAIGVAFGLATAAALTRSAVQYQSSGSAHVYRSFRRTAGCRRRGKLPHRAPRFHRGPDNSPARRMTSAISKLRKLTYG